MKTLFGIAHVGAGEPVVIEACGSGTRSRWHPDPVEDVKIVHKRSESARTVGTAVTIALPITWRVDVEAWLQNFAMINPHATFILQGVRGDVDGASFYKSTVGDRWSKPLPNDKLVAGLVRRGRADGG